MNLRNEHIYMDNVGHTQRMHTQVHVSARNHVRMAVSAKSLSW